MKQFPEPKGPKYQYHTRFAAARLPKEQRNKVKVDILTFTPGPVLTKRYSVGTFRSYIARNYGVMAFAGGLSQMKTWILKNTSFKLPEVIEPWMEDLGRNNRGFTCSLVKEPNNTQILHIDIPGIVGKPMDVLLDLLSENMIAAIRDHEPTAFLAIPIVLHLPRDLHNTTKRLWSILVALQTSSHPLKDTWSRDLVNVMSSSDSIYLRTISHRFRAYLNSQSVTY